MKTMCSRFLLVLALLASPAWALDLDEAKSEGLVGERPDGYLGVVHGGDEAVALVREINEKRRRVYEEIAAKRGTPVGAVEALAGEKAMQRTPSGQYVLEGSHWVRK